MVHNQHCGYLAERFGFVRGKLRRRYDYLIIGNEKRVKLHFRPFLVAIFCSGVL